MMRINKVLSLVLLIATASDQMAQDSTATTARIELSGNYAINSNAITASFYEHFYNGGFIDNGLKDQVSNRLSTSNSFGVEAESKVLYFSEPVNGPWSVYAGLGYNVELGTQFTRDLFNVVFYGNATYANKTADLSGTQVKYMESQSLHFGLSRALKTDSLTSKKSIRFGFNVVKGQNWYDIKVDKGSLFTEQNGAFLDIVLKGNSYHSDNTRSDLAAFNGVGLGLNFAYKVEKKNGIQYSVELSNLGLMQWGAHSVRSSVDTSFHFEGLAIKNIFTISDSTFNNISVAGASDNLKSETKSQTMVLPFTIRGKCLYPLNAKNYLTAELNYKYWANYIPKLMLSYGYRLSTLWSVELSGGYGGYGQMHAGLAAKYSAAHVQLSAGASDFLGFVAPSSFSNQGAFVMASYVF